ncbi:N-acetylmuramoyl-L-alanine amidase family protein [Candidatus Methylacidithermus pantelleriae]|uniref:N-acetylmuramoyl-L-alanine amidase family protein n=1 Tax=Candidatus Methylacidithermus pantelleriae TaxID=2744239 RepID=UPI00157CCA88|nr:N-acetylmuramoyl-L-alanine amidase [Candidatus Methylacidithermus pantelleriae]
MSHGRFRKAPGQRASYEALEPFCRAKGIRMTQDVATGSLCLSKAGHLFQLRRADRVATFDGVRHWLSYAPKEERGRWFLARADLRELEAELVRGPSSAHIRYHGVVIDPGHGGSNRGARSCLGQWEKVYTLDTALRLARILRQHGIPVVLTRTLDQDVSLSERVRIAGMHPGFVFVSIHFNDAPSRKGCGVETYCLPPAGAPSTYGGGHLIADSSQTHWCVGNRNDPDNLWLAHRIHHEVVRLGAKETGEWDRGVKHARFRVLRDNPLPSVLVEGGFLSNRREARLVDSSSYRQELAQAIARGILAFFRSEEPRRKKLPHLYQAEVRPEKASSRTLAEGHSLRKPTTTGGLSLGD